MHQETEPYDRGMLDVGDGQLVYWEVCGNPEGKPAVVLHGGPGSGAGAFWRRFFDPAKYRVVLFDQRGCGRSTPDAAEPDADLSTNTTWHLVADIEQLREQLGIEQWLVLGASWGATLAFAYAEQHPSAVSEIVVFSVTSTTPREVEWITRDMSRIFPEEWTRFLDVVPVEERDGNLALAYSRLLHDPDPAVRDRAARAWCEWEDTHVSTYQGFKPDPRYEDPTFRLRFARLVSHYWGHAGWIEDGALLRDAPKLAGIPGVLITGRLDISSPPDTAWRLAQAWPDAELHIVTDAGHGAGKASVSDLVLTAIDRFATQPKS
ncbi:prolyl aminopeptidase [Streptomyces sp. SID13031]|uniref:prolyl aminopeptidase n=1 Tax=Streptomyces sp. SID13031 TaxID=2706046 RepID=UPI0013C83CDF|nr:prolyl aminopeptidase [Streptomyces sp. SID13031]NEA36437.1 prolyl aminopeptidase [Streptomyces sp. SID13031]